MSIIEVQKKMGKFFLTSETSGFTIPQKRKYAKTLYVNL